MSSRIRKLLLLSLLLAFLFGVGMFARESLGISFSPKDLSSETLRAHLRSLGPYFPLACIALVAFRSFMGIPSGAALLLVGIVAGATQGLLYGTLGLVLSGTTIFLVARIAGRETVEARIPERFKYLLDLIGDRAGVLLVLFGTGYPLGLLTPLHAVAGISAMSIVSFEFALTLGAAARAATYIYFGSSLVEGELEPILLSTGLLLLAIVLPLLFPGSRRWLKKMLGRSQAG